MRRDRTWTYGVCEICLKNCHEEVKMIKETICSPFSDLKQEMWVCSKCGSTKKF